MDKVLAAQRKIEREASKTQLVGQKLVGLVNENPLEVS